MTPNLPTKRPEPEETFTGQVHKYHSNFYYVAVSEADFSNTLLACSIKGMLKKALKADDEAGSVLVGDHVTLDNVDPVNNTARIIKIAPRRNLISRPKIANVDQVIVVHPYKEPDFDTTQVDRYLIRIALSQLPAVVCVSKSDLVDDRESTLDDIKALYHTQLGYPVVFTSIYEAEELNILKAKCQQKISVMAGPSGGGKSSLLNALNPKLNLKTGDVSAKIERGQHTTRHVELVAVGNETFIADTPGFSQLRFDDVLPRQLENAFHEFSPYRSQCSFSDCLHKDEDGCAVLSSTGADKIPESRYASYRLFLEEALTYKQQAQDSSDKSEYGYKKIQGKGNKEVNILRLKEKNREASRRTQRQQVSSMLDDVETDDLD